MVEPVITNSKVYTAQGTSDPAAQAYGFEIGNPSTVVDQASGSSSLAELSSKSAVDSDSVSRLKQSGGSKADEADAGAGSDSHSGSAPASEPATLQSIRKVEYRAGDAEKDSFLLGPNVDAMEAEAAAAEKSKAEQSQTATAGSNSGSLAESLGPKAAPTTPSLSPALLSSLSERLLLRKPFASCLTECGAAGDCPQFCGAGVCCIDRRTMEVYGEHAFAEQRRLRGAADPDSSDSSNSTVSDSHTEAYRAEREKFLHEFFAGLERRGILTASRGSSGVDHCSADLNPLVRGLTTHRCVPRAGYQVLPEKLHVKGASYGPANGQYELARDTHGAVLLHKGKPAWERNERRAKRVRGGKSDSGGYDSHTDSSAQISSYLPEKFTKVLMKHGRKYRRGSHSGRIMGGDLGVNSSPAAEDSLALTRRHHRPHRRTHRSPFPRSLPHLPEGETTGEQPWLHWFLSSDLPGAEKGSWAVSHYGLKRYYRMPEGESPSDASLYMRSGAGSADTAGSGPGSRASKHYRRDELRFPTSTDPDRRQWVDLGAAGHVRSRNRQPHIFLMEFKRIPVSALGVSDGSSEVEEAGLSSAQSALSELELAQAIGDPELEKMATEVLKSGEKDANGESHSRTPVRRSQQPNLHGILTTASYLERGSRRPYPTELCSDDSQCAATLHAAHVHSLLDVSTHAKQAFNLRDGKGGISGAAATGSGSSSSSATASASSRRAQSLFQRVEKHAKAGDHHSIAAKRSKVEHALHAVKHALAFYLNPASDSSFLETEHKMVNSDKFTALKRSLTDRLKFNAEDHTRLHKHISAQHAELQQKLYPSSFVQREDGDELAEAVKARFRSLDVSRPKPYSLHEVMKWVEAGSKVFPLETHGNGRSSSGGSEPGSDSLSLVQKKVSERDPLSSSRRAKKSRVMHKFFALSSFLELNEVHTRQLAREILRRKNAAAAADSSHSAENQDSHSEHSDPDFADSHRDHSAQLHAAAISLLEKAKAAHRETEGLAAKLLRATADTAVHHQNNMENSAHGVVSFVEPRHISDAELHYAGRHILLGHEIEGFVDEKPHVEEASTDYFVPEQNRQSSESGESGAVSESVDGASQKPKFSEKDVEPFVPREVASTGKPLSFVDTAERRELEPQPLLQQAEAKPTASSTDTTASASVRRARIPANKLPLVFAFLEMRHRQRYHAHLNLLAAVVADEETRPEDSMRHFPNIHGYGYDNLRGKQMRLVLNLLENPHARNNFGRQSFSTMHTVSGDGSSDAALEDAGSSFIQTKARSRHVENHEYLKQALRAHQNRVNPLLLSYLQSRSAASHGSELSQHPFHALHSVMQRHERGTGPSTRHGETSHRNKLVNGQVSVSGAPLASDVEHEAVESQNYERLLGVLNLRSPHNAMSRLQEGGSPVMALLEQRSKSSGTDSASDSDDTKLLSVSEQTQSHRSTLHAMSYLVKRILSFSDRHYIHDEGDAERAAFLLSNAHGEVEEFN